MILAFLVLVAALLPGVTSGPRLAGIIADYISADADLPVVIADSRWSWWGGLELKDFRTQLGDAGQVAIERVTVQTGLWDLLQGHNLRDIHADGLTVDLAVGQVQADPPQGNPPAYQMPVTTRAANLMKKRKPGKASPANTIPVNRLILSRCVVNARDESTGQSTHIFFPAVQVDLDRKTGAVGWRISAKVGQAGLVATEGDFILQKLAVEPKEFGGWLRVAWSGLPLDALPTAVLRKLGLQALGGSTAGQMHLRLDPDPSSWTVTYDLSSSTSDLAMRDVTGRQVRLSQAGAGLAGRWQMLPEQIEVQSAWLELPGAKVRAAGPALVYDAQTSQVVRSSLVGTVEDAAALRATLADLGVRLPEPLELTGRAAFEAHVDRQKGGMRIELGASGEQLAASWPGVLDRRPGSPLSVRAVCRLADDGSLAIESGRVDLPGGYLAFSAELAAAVDKIRAVVLRHSRAEFHWDDFRSFASQWPVVGNSLQRVGTVRGPGGLDLWADLSEKDGMSAGALVTLPEGAEVRLDDWFGKPLGRDLRVEVNAALSPRFDAVGLDHITIESAGQTIVRLQDIRARASRQMQLDGDAKEPLLLIDINAALAQLDLSAVQGFSPRLADAIGRAGRVGGSVQGRTAISCWADVSAKYLQFNGINAAGQVNLDQAALQIEGVIRKAAGERLRLAGTYSDQWGARKGQGYGSGSIEAAGFAGQGWYERSSEGNPGPAQWSWGWLDIQDVERATAVLPAVARAMNRDILAGQATARWEWSRQSDSFDLHTLFDLTGVQAATDEAGINKRAGLPARVDIVVSGPAGKAVGQEARRWRVPRAEFTLGQSHAGINDGELEIAEPWARLLAGQAREALGRIDFTWPIRQARAKVSGVTVFGEVPVSRDLKTLLDRFEAVGPVQWTCDWTYSFEKGIDFAADLQAGDLALAAGPLDKIGGVPLHTGIKGKVEAFSDDTNVPHVRLTVADATGQVSNLEWKGQADMLYRYSGGGMDLQTARVSSSGQSKNLGEFVLLVPSAKDWQLQGHAAWEGVCTFDKQKGWQLEDLDIGLWPVEGAWLGTPLRVEGLVNIQQDSVASTGLAARAGATQGRFTFHVAREGNVLVDQFGAAFEMIDVDELIGLYKKAGEQMTPGARVEGLVASDSSKDSEHAGTANGTRRIVQEGQPHHALPLTQPAGGSPLVDLARSHLEFLGATNGLHFTIEPGMDPVNMRLLSWEGSLADGEVKVDLSGAFEGGALTAQVTGRADGREPFRIHYRADRAQPTKLTQWMVVRSFPGMRVDGPVTLDEMLLIDPASKDPAIPSSGEMIVEGGEVWGAAAPKAVQRIFPGLELARFKYSRLHNWFEKDAQGKGTNRIIFRGSPWSMYMNGWSKPDGTFRYEIGVDLLGSIESEYWATADRGRVPLFIKTGQVIGGKMHNEVIRYLTPQQIVGRILKDNLMTIAYHAVRQQVLGGRSAKQTPVPSPASQPKGR